MPVLPLSFFPTSIWMDPNIFPSFFFFITLRREQMLLPHFFLRKKTRVVFRGVYLIQCRSPPDAFSLLAQSSRLREREAAFTEISNRVAIFMNRVSPTMDTSDRRSAPGNILFTQTRKRVHTYRHRLTRRERTIQWLNRRGSWIVEESLKREGERERLDEKEETIRGYMRCLFSSMIKFFFFPPPSAFYRIYPAFWSQTLFVFCSHFCAGTIVYKSFDSARRKKKKEKKEETVEMEK